jgi:Bacterial protein of unknown function (DUF937)
MAINLVSLVSQYLTPQVIGSLARAVGVNDAAAQKLVAAAVPTILAALATAAAAPGGAQKVSDAVSNADPDLLTKLRSGVAGGNTQLLSEGANLLGGLLGGGGLASLAGALSQHSGAPQGAAQSIIGAVSQVVMGTIGQQDPSNWSDASSILSMFNNEKNAISAALPAEVSKALGTSGLLAGLGAIGAGAAQTAASAVSSAASTAGTTAASAARSATSAASSAASSLPRSTPTPSTPPVPPPSRSFPIWAIVLIVIVVLVAIYWFMTQGEKPAEPAKQGMLNSPAMIEYVLHARPPAQG